MQSSKYFCLVYFNFFSIENCSSDQFRRTIHSWASFLQWSDPWGQAKNTTSKNNKMTKNKKTELHLHFVGRKTKVIEKYKLICSFMFSHWFVEWKLFYFDVFDILFVKLLKLFLNNNNMYIKFKKFTNFLEFHSQELQTELFAENRWTFSEGCLFFQIGPINFIKNHWTHRSYTLFQSDFPKMFFAQVRNFSNQGNR